MEVGCLRWSSWWQGLQPHHNNPTNCTSCVADWPASIAPMVMLAHALHSPEARPVQRLCALQQHKHEHLLPMRCMPRTMCCPHVHALLP